MSHQQRRPCFVPSFEQQAISGRRVSCHWESVITGILPPCFLELSSLGEELLVSISGELTVNGTVFTLRVGLFGGNGSECTFQGSLVQVHGRQSCGFESDGSNCSCCDVIVRISDFGNTNNIL